MPMIPSKLDRETFVIEVDRREADDLAALLHALEVDCGDPEPDSGSDAALIRVAAYLDGAELDRVAAIVAEFNKMRSSRASS
jgi:hypothetical protein